jgi:ubiquinone/menaquinone biosynthesis C-methylase UbiE/DNA-binding transcriptional ArsR family regulator
MNVALSMEQLLGGLRAAGEPTRLRILGLLVQGELTVTELTQILRQSQPRVSRHLKLLCEAGLLERFREGTWIFYRLAEDGGNGRLARSLVHLIPESDQAFIHDQERLSAVRQARAEAAAAYFSANAGNWNHIRSLYVPEVEVEQALKQMAGDAPIGDFLDIGTGTGRMLEVFAGDIQRGLGVDMSREMLALARSKLEEKGITNCQVRQGDMYDLAMPDASIDLAVIHQVLHFADEPALAIQEVARVLRPGGRALIVDFSPHDMEILRDQHAHRRLGFAQEEVTGWCRAAGLDPKAVNCLAGGELTVCIWLAEKPEAAPRTMKQYKRS